MTAERHGSGQRSAFTLFLLFALDLMQRHVDNPEWEQRRSWTSINELQPLDVVKQCFYGDAGIYFLLNCFAAW